MITEPGIYDIDNDTYHADPCDTPSLSAGMITNLLSAPAKCYDASSRLNPNYEETEIDGKFTIGTVSHIMFLEPHLFNEKVVVLDFDDWRKKEAKTARDDAKANGKTAILTHHMGKVNAARRAFYANEFAAKAFLGGKFEQSMFWRHPTYGFWCRARPDFLHDCFAHMNDYKATTNADPAQFGKHAYSMGYHRRAAWYLEGAEILFGKRPAHYWFCNQETKSPYLTSVVELDPNAIEAGQEENNRAAAIYDRCLRSNEWPGYRHAYAPDKDMAFRVGLPNYAYIQIDERNY